jgi:hypothetical protein
MIMKNISFFNEKDSYLLTDLTFMKKPLTDTNILDLQEKFLTNGLHHITVPTIQDGRTLIFTFLNSLSFVLHTIACVTASGAQLPSGVIDIHKQLSSNEGFNTLNNDYMQDFLFEQGYFDFIWVEMTPSLATSSWYVDFEKNFFDLKMDKNIPVLMVSYEK